MNGLCQAHSSCARSGTLPVPFSDLDKWLLTKGYSGTELLFKKALTWPHTEQRLFCMKPSLLIHFKSVALAHGTSEPLILSGALFQSPQSSVPTCCWGNQVFSSPHVSQCLTYIRKKNESSTNPHPNSQTFLNPKQESQACDKERYSCPPHSLIFLFFSFFFISFFSLCKNISEQINVIFNNLLCSEITKTWSAITLFIRKRGISVVVFNTINLLNQL